MQDWTVMMIVFRISGIVSLAAHNSAQEGEGVGDEEVGFTTRHWRRTSPSVPVLTSIWLIVSMESAKEDVKELVDKTLNMVGSLVDQLSNRIWSDCKTPLPPNRLE